MVEIADHLYIYYANARAMYQQYINQKLDDTSGDQTQTAAQGYNGLAVCDMAEGS